jgi:hypothetical protein
MHQTRKGQQWYFGMKLHIGVDSKTGLAHSAVVTAANVHDKHPLPALLHGQEKQLYGDSAYASQQELIRSKAPKAADLTNQRVRKGSATEELERLINRAKSRVGRVSSTCSVSSSGCGASTRCATAAWPRTPRARSSRSGWPTSSWREGYCMKKSACNGRQAGQWLAAQPERGRGAAQLRPEIALRGRNQPRFSVPAEQHYWMASSGALFSVAS